MKFVLFGVIFSTLTYLSNQSDNYRVMNYDGEELPIYTGLYYRVINKRSGFTWANRLLVPLVDPQNANHWKKFEKNSRWLNGYDMSNDYYYYFEKVDENYYRIVQVFESGAECSGEPIADGQYLEAATPNLFCCINCPDKFADEFQWMFIEMPDYKLNAIMTDFQYELPLEDIIKQHVKKVDLLETSVITNDSPAKITEEISNEIKKTQSFEISYSKSIAISAKFFAKCSAHASVSAKILGIGASTDITTEFGMELGVDTTTTTGNSKSVSNEVTYTIKKTVELPPYEKVEVLSYVNWVDNLSLPYKSKVTVTGVAPRFEDDSRLDSKTMIVLLSKYGFDESLIESTATSLTFEAHGIFTGSFGLDSVFTVTSLGKTRNRTKYYNVITSQSLASNGDYIISY